MDEQNVVCPYNRILFSLISPHRLWNPGKVGSVIAALD